MALAGLAVLGLVEGCTGPDADTPVPTTAGEPFVCTGVPRAGVELALGGAAASVEEEGTWGREGRGFSCSVRRSSGDGVVQVLEWDVVAKLGVTGEEALDLFSRERDATEIRADVPGAGYAIGDAADGSAKWVCGDRMITVSLIGVPRIGRDERVDAEALLRSMLPWACGDEDAPPRTAD